jgi:hypothetical protein
VFANFVDDENEEDLEVKKEKKSDDKKIEEFDKKAEAFYKYITTTFQEDFKPDTTKSASLWLNNKYLDIVRFIHECNEVKRNNFMIYEDITKEIIDYTYANCAHFVREIKTVYKVKMDDGDSVLEFIYSKNMRDALRNCYQISIRGNIKENKEKEKQKEKEEVKIEDPIQWSVKYVEGSYSGEPCKIQILKKPVFYFENLSFVEEIWGLTLRTWFIKTVLHEKELTNDNLPEYEVIDAYFNQLAADLASKKKPFHVIITIENGKKINQTTNTCYYKGEIRDGVYNRYTSLVYQYSG